MLIYFIAFEKRRGGKQKGLKRELKRKSFFLKVNIDVDVIMCKKKTGERVVGRRVELNNNWNTLFDKKEG